MRFDAPHAWYRRDGGQRSYSWVKNTLQAAKVVKKAAKRGAHRKRREPAPWPGMLLHQDGSTHEWVPGRHWDLMRPIPGAPPPVGVLRTPQSAPAACFLPRQGSLQHQAVFRSGKGRLTALAGQAQA